MDQESEKLTLYLLRHAQSTGNTRMKLDAEAEKISDRGKIEINLLGMHLSPVKFDYVYSSDYERASLTAKGVLKRSIVNAETTIYLDERLREVDFGIYEKSSYEKVFNYMMKLKEPFVEKSFPEGESFPEAGERMLKFTEEICEKVLRDSSKRCHSPNILFVSHSGSIMSFMNILQQSDHEIIGWDAKELKLIKNTSYMKFEIRRKSPCNSGQNNKSLWQFTILEKPYSKHLDCINEGTGLHNVNPLIKFARGNTSAAKYQNCAQQ